MDPIQMLKLAWPLVRPVIVADLTAQVMTYAAEYKVSLLPAQAGEVAEAVAKYMDTVLNRAS